MADLEARREARRRKILENSQKRLSKITGIEDKSTVAEVDGVVRNSYHNEIPKVEPEISSYFNNEVHSSDSSEEIRTVFTNTNFVRNSVSDVNVAATDQRNSKQFNIMIMSLIHSALFTLFDHLQVGISTLILGQIFLPLLALEFIYICFGLNVKHSSNFFDTVLVFANIKSRSLKIYVTFFQYFCQIMQDVMVYFFVFVLSHSCITFIVKG